MEFSRKSAIEDRAVPLMSLTSTEVRFRMVGLSPLFWLKKKAAPIAIATIAMIAIMVLLLAIIINPWILIKKVSEILYPFHGRLYGIKKKGVISIRNFNSTICD